MKTLVPRWLNSMDKFAPSLSQSFSTGSEQLYASLTSPVPGQTIANAMATGAPAWGTSMANSFAAIIPGLGSQFGQQAAAQMRDVRVSVNMPDGVDTGAQTVAG